MLTAYLTLALVTAAAPPDTVVVCPAPLRSALAPWIKHRESQGHACKVVNTGTADEVRAQIRTVAAGGRLRYIVLVGDAPNKKGGGKPAPSVPTHYVDSKVIQRFKGGPTIATDNWYADLDDDDLPDVAVGRLTADNLPELKALVARILAYERTVVPGDWRRRISLVAGLGGFGQVADAAIEAAAKRLLIEGIPSAYTTTVTYGSWRSPYCPDPRQFHDATLARFNDGCLFLVYMGHGQTRELDRVKAPDREYHIFGAADCGKLQCSDYPPIALLLCCSAGGYDQPQDCLGEEFLRAPGGPVAVLAGSRVTMPYAMSVLGAEMLRAYFQERVTTVGDLLLVAKRQSVLRPRDDEKSKAMDALAAMLNPASTDLAAERAEHLHLFNLLGDPLLELPQAAEVAIKIPAKAAPGSTIEVSGSSPIDGEADVELVVRRDRLTFRGSPRSKYETTDAASREFMDTYQKANDSRLVAVKARVERGKFNARLVVPESANGVCHVRVFVRSPRDVAVGAADVSIESAGAQQTGR